MAIGIRRIKWLRYPTAWEQTQQWNSTRKSMVSSFQSSASAASSSFSDAWQNQISGSGTIAAQRALSRINTSTQNKLATAQTASTSLPDISPNLSSARVNEVIAGITGAPVTTTDTTA